MEQLAECLKHGGEDADTPANLWLSDLINAHVRPLHDTSSSCVMLLRSQGRVGCEGGCSSL